MQKIFLTLALAATAFAALPVITQAAEDNSGFFINGQVGRSHANKNITDDNDTGFGINGGYRWDWFGVEIGYVDLGNFNNDIYLFRPVGSAVLARADAELHGFTIGVNAHFNINDNWYISGRAGGFQFHGKQDVTQPNIDFPTLVRESESGFKPYIGVGVGYDFTSNFGIGLNYDYFDAKKHDIDLSSDLISLSLEYRFH